MSHSVNGNGTQIKMYTTSWCPDCWRAKSVMRGNGVNFEEIDIESDEDARELVQKLNKGNMSVPTIVFPRRRCVDRAFDNGADDQTLHLIAQIHCTQAMLPPVVAPAHVGREL